MIRDELAFLRTHLANERTALAYVRTSLAFSAAGVALIQFVPSLPSVVSGWCLIGVGLVILTAGIIRFISIRKRIIKPFA
jgi:putative membrane protein